MDGEQPRQLWELWDLLGTEDNGVAVPTLIPHRNEYSFLELRLKLFQNSQPHLESRYSLLDNTLS